MSEGPLRVPHELIKVDDRDRQNELRKERTNCNEKPCIFHLSHASIQQLSELPPKTQTIHFIRDPRGIILSSLRYHLKSNENWLHIKSSAYGEMSYQEKLKSLNSYCEQLVFEMENSSKDNIWQMFDIFESKSPEILNVRLEEVSHDNEMRIYLKMGHHLGFRGRQLLQFINAACRSSLWFNTSLPSHATTGVKSIDFESEFPFIAQQKYSQLYGNLHCEMGYSG